MKYIATISFGKDSTVMCDLLLKNGYQVDYIIFNDTLMEFPMMYEYKIKVEKYFKERYGMQIITTKPKKTFEETIFGIIKQKGAERIGWIRGVPNPVLGFCEWRRDSKIVPQDNLIKELVGKEEYKTYIGFTLDESKRKMKGDEFLYPLIDIFKITERNCQEYLINQEMQNPLYNFFSRTGCGICPAQSERAWFEIWKNFKDTWNYMKFVEERFDFYESRGYQIVNRFWFQNEIRTEDIEKKFRLIDKQGSLFDFSDEPLKDCFCKI